MLGSDTGVAFGVCDELGYSQEHVLAGGGRQPVVARDQVPGRMRDFGVAIDREPEAVA